MLPENFLQKNAKNLILCTLLALAILSVYKHKSVEVRHQNNYELYSSYVESYTTGIISRQSRIQIRLSADVQTLHTQNEAIEEKLFHFSPEIKGKAFWADSRTIEFRPDANLEPAKIYTASIDLSQLMEVPPNLKTFRFDFETIKPDFSIDFAGLRSMSNNASEKMKLTGSITTADIEETALIEKLLAVNYDTNTKISWAHNLETRNHTFTIENIQRYKNDKNLIINYDGKPLNIEGKGTEEVEVPAVNNFRVLSLRVIQGEEQYVSVLFSDPIRIGQELNGLLGISESEMPAYAINGNEIKLYPSLSLDGHHTIFVNEGIENFEGKKLPVSFSGSVTFQNTEPSVSIPGQGVILPHSGRLMTPFEAVNLNAVDVSIIKIYGNNIPQYLQQNKLDGENQLRQVAKPVKQLTIKLNADKSLNLHKKNRFMLDIDKLIRTEPGAIYRITIGYRPSYSVYSCKSKPSDAENENEDNEDEYDEGSPTGIDEDDEFWSRYDNYYPYGYNWNERKDPCSSSYYNKERWASRNVLASNIGLIAKQGNNNNLTIAVTDILSAEPMVDVELELLDFQKQIIGRAKSGADGIVEIQLPRKPYLLIAKKTNERGYLKLDDAGSLPLSRFNVGGAVVQKGIKGFIYGERGVWRPGDSLFLTFILDDKQNKLPKNHPVDFELYTPQGQLFKRTTETKSLNGFYTFKTLTESTSPTGNWTAKVKAGGARFEKRIRIETIMPNRLKINLSFNNKTQLTKDEGIKGLLKAEWLFGGAAKNLQAKVDAFLSSGKTTFRNFEQYSFDDPIRPFGSQLQNVFDGKLDENGITNIDANINPEQQAPGILNAHFLVKVFEPGGNFSINQVSMPYHPYSGYVGIKTPEGARNSGMLVTDVNHLIEIVNVDPSGRLRSGNRKVEIELYKVKWRWWWDEEENSVSNFTQDEYNKLISTSTLQLNNGKGSWNLRINQPEWGRYLIRVRDLETGHSTGKFVYIDWPNWGDRLQNENPSEAAMLSFTSNKEKYKVGEEAILTIPASNAGRGLISIENGSRVLKTFWFEAKKGQTQFRFRVDKEMTPNVFVNVTLLQPHSQTVNDLPIRMYGVIPIEVEDPSTVLRPLITMANEIKPETEASVTVSEASGKRMTYSIAIVDEGLLDISNFETPNPHASFYARESLGVKTWDLFDYVIGAYGGELQRILSIGGDRQSGKGGKNPTANRFKPVVKYLGPFTSNGNKQTHKFTLPQYVGSVKVMVIAGENGAYGTSEKAVKVKKPLMVLATMPRVLSPGEQLHLPVTVFAMDKGIKDVTIEINSNAFTYPSGQRKRISFAKPGDQMHYLDLVTKDFSGIARLKVIARSGRETAVHDIELDVRNPSPLITKVLEKTLTAGSSLSMPFKSFGTAGTSKAVLEISSIPPINLEKRLNYLLQYPHGCVEQTTSSAFPQLYLSTLMDLSAGRQAMSVRNIKAAINRLKGFQLPDGSMSYWPGAGEADEWSTNYAGHFMLEAEAKGFTLPVGFVSQWKQFQKTKAVSWTPSTTNFYGGDLLQAYRLYLLALSKAPELGAMNRLKEFKYLSPAAKWRLAAAYRLAGQPEAALQLIKNLPLTVKEYKQSSGTFGSDLRDQAMILETLTLLGQHQAANQLVRTISAKLSQENWYSTQTTAYSLIAISKYCAANTSGKRIQVSYRINNNASSVNVNSYIMQLPVKLLGNNVASLTNKGTNTLFIRLINEGKPAIGQQIEEENNPNILSMRIGYFSLNGELLNPEKLVQGTDFVAQVNVRNPGKRGRYDNLALTQLFPSGWEIINTRLMENDEAFRPSPSDYRDIRDDRVNTYFSLHPDKEATYFVLLNASYVGRFYLPPSQCQAMYDGSISASTEGKWIEVVNAIPPLVNASKQ